MEQSSLDTLLVYTKKGTISQSDSVLIKRLIDRCNKANLKNSLEVIKDLKDFYWVSISLPCGRDTRDVIVFGLERFKKINGVEFEKYSFIQGYDAICCYRLGFIEAYVKSVGFVSDYLLSRLLNISMDEIKKYNKKDLVFTVKHKTKPLSITISQTTDTMTALSLGPSDKNINLSVKIENAKISTNEEAKALLEKLANAFFFQIQASIGIPIMLETHYEIPELEYKPVKRSSENISFPLYEYERDPINLYWYAKQATKMPLIQFLAYYQVLEYYFPIYSKKEANIAVANILKDPAFDASRDSDIGRIISATLSRVGKGYAEEKQQLKATICHCVQSEEMREFMESEHFKNYFKSDYKKLSNTKISLENKDVDIREQVTERLYEIRCKIVHTKSSGVEGNYIIPFTEEESILVIENHIIEFIARKVIIAGGCKLSI